MAAPRDLVIGVDCSTTSVKAVVWDRNGRAVSEGRRSLSLLSPHPTWREQAAEDWWIGTAGALRDAVAAAGQDRIAALCLAHQRESFVPVDEQGQPLRNAILWIDERSHAQVDWLKEHLGEGEYHRISGKPLALTPSLPKLLWLRDHEPQVLERAFKVLDVHAFLIHRLTGGFRTSWPSADPTGLFDMAGHTWSQEILVRCGLSMNLLPELVPPGDPIGGVTAAAASECGLPSGLPIIAGAGDGQAAGLGAGVASPGRAYLNLGTAVVSGAYTQTYITDKAFRTMGGCIPGTYYAETVLRAGTYIVSWFVDKFGMIDRAEQRLPVSVEEIFEIAAARVPPGSLGLMLVPYWSSVMNPYWDTRATGIIVGWTGAHERQHLYRAILEGIGFEQRLFEEGREQALKCPTEEYVAVGGGARSALWRQIIADITGRRVLSAANPETTSLGAGMLAAAGAGLHPDIRSAAAAMSGVEREHRPDPGNREIYDRLYEEVYRHLFPAVQPYIDRLSDLTRAEPEA
ncbi:MAG: xylulokinase [Rudaea sp.]